MISSLKIASYCSAAAGKARRIFRIIKQREKTEEKIFIPPHKLVVAWPCFRAVFLTHPKGMQAGAGREPAALHPTAPCSTRAPMDTAPSANGCPAGPANCGELHCLEILSDASSQQLDGSQRQCGGSFGLWCRNHLSVSRGAGCLPLGTAAAPLPQESSGK